MLDLLFEMNFWKSTKHFNGSFNDAREKFKVAKIEFQFLGQNVNRIDDLSRFNQLLSAGSWTSSNGAC